jgi:hypoxanthine phosphoribosyltransferase
MSSSFEIGFDDLQLSIKWRLLKLIYKQKWRFYPLLRLFIAVKYSWLEVELAVAVLVRKTASYNPELIVGVGVGGAILAAMIAGNAEDRDFVVLDRKVQWNDGKRNVLLNGSRALTSQNVKDKRILIVTAEVISGATMERSVELLLKRGAIQIKKACFVKLNTSSFVPDYFVYSTSAIVQMPWRIMEEYHNPDQLIRY